MSLITPDSAVDTIANLTGNILVAEDNKQEQQHISRLISMSDCNITMVDNGEDALKLAIEANFDLILMDLKMPLLDGIEATQLLRFGGYNKPIVAISADATEEDIQKFDGFLPKPIDHKDFFAILLNHIKKASTEKAESGDNTGNDAIYMKLVGRFKEELTPAIRLIRQYADNNDWIKLKDAIHDLKGMGGGFGYPELTELSKRIESATISGDYDKALKLVCELENLGLQITDD